MPLKSGELFIFATNTDTSWLEVRVGDLPRCRQTRGERCNARTQSYQNWLDEGDLDIIELRPQKQVRHHRHYSRIMPLCGQPKSDLHLRKSCGAWTVVGISGQGEWWLKKSHPVCLLPKTKVCCWWHKHGTITLPSPSKERESEVETMGIQFYTVRSWALLSEPGWTLKVTRSSRISNK